MTRLSGVRIAQFQAGWMLAVVAVLAAFDQLSLPLVLTAGLLSLVLLVETATPRTEPPPWITGLRWFVLLSLVVFAAYVGYRLLLLLPDGSL